MPSSNDLSRHTEDLKVHAKEAIHTVSEQINEQANIIRDATAVARYNTRDFIETNPWQSVAIAAGIGFLLGVAFTRR